MFPAAQAVVDDQSEVAAGNDGDNRALTRFSREGGRDRGPQRPPEMTRALSASKRMARLVSSRLTTI